MKYLVTYEARVSSASGVFYPVERVMEADGPQSAHDKAFDLLHEEGFETTHMISVKALQ
jgi:hypothetical protein